jgi:hypothetical protein
VKSLLSSKADDNALKQNITFIISLALVDHMQFFNMSLKDIVPNHLPHTFEKEMSMQSKVVSHV